MSIASRVIQAVAFAGLQCSQVSYNGEDDTYLTINMDAIPDMFCDDAPDADVWLVQLHLFAPFSRDTTRIRRQLRKAIFEAGFTYPDMTDASLTIRSTDGTEQHIIFEFEGATGVNEDDV